MTVLRVATGVHDCYIIAVGFMTVLCVAVVVHDCSMCS